MDAQKILDCLKDTSQAKTIPIQEWESLSKEYTYFTASHWLGFAASPASKEKLPKMAMYKSSPTRFASFIEDCLHPKLIQNISVPEEIDTILEEKIVEEISHSEELMATPEEFQSEDIHFTEASIEEAYMNETTKILEEVDHDAQDILDIVQNLPHAPIELEVKDEEIFEDILHDLDALALHQEDKVMMESIEINQENKSKEEDKSLMVMMDFSDWLNHFKHKQIKDQEEEKDQKALKNAWKKEKLAAAVEEELDDIPDNIFKQAMDSISLESSIISESLAEILAKQGKKDKAIDMYKKLSLRNPEKSSYFASLIKDLNLNNF